MTDLGRGSAREAPEYWGLFLRWLLVLVTAAIATVQTVSADLIRLDPQIEAAVSYDDNRLLDPNDPMPLERYSLRSNIDLSSTTDRHSIVANLAAQYVETSDEAVERSRTDLEFSVDATRDWSQLTRVGVNFDIAQQSLLDEEVFEAGVAPEDETLVRLNTGINIERTLTARNTLGARLVRNELDFSGQTLTDVTSTTAQIQLDRMITERDQFSFDLGVRLIEPDEQADQLNANRLELGFVGVGGQHALTEKMTVQGRLQAVYIDDGNDTSVELAPELQLAYEGRRFDASAGIQRGFNASGFGGLREVDQVTAQIARRFGVQADIGMSASYLESRVFGTENNQNTTSFGAFSTFA
ncbi:MAG: hypothetical protein AAFU69_09880, partial [Pseudomonadota bacterium]